jgi:hypothetical protein
VELVPETSELLGAKLPLGGRGAASAPMRGDAQRASIRVVVDTFGDDARHLVLVGGCVLGLYAREQGAPLRVTTDVDCISTRSPWVLQEKLLADLLRAWRAQARRSSAVSLPHQWH